MRIDIKPIELEQQVVTELQEMFLEINPTYIRHRIKFVADEPVNADDLMCGWRPIQTDCDWRVKKEFITSIDRVYNSENKFWKIVITVLGSNSDLKFFFRKQSECERVYEIIFNYLFDIPCGTSAL